MVNTPHIPRHIHALVLKFGIAKDDLNNARAEAEKYLASLGDNVFTRMMKGPPTEEQKAEGQRVRHLIERAELASRHAYEELIPELTTWARHERIAVYEKSDGDETEY
jgi:hypothetical protein